MNVLIVRSGSDPVHQDRPHHGLDLSIINGAVLIAKPILRIIPCAIEARRIAANIAKLPELLISEGQTHDQIQDSDSNEH
jgi:hypothetical protein